MIHIIDGGSFPIGMAGTKRIICYAKGLALAGANVEVLCYQRIYSGPQRDNYPEEGVYENIPYKYISGKYKSSNPFARKLDWFILDAVRAFFYIILNFKRGDIIHLYVYDNFAQICVLTAAAIRGCKVVKETCEHPSALASGNIVAQFARWFDYHIIMHHYDGFVTISKPLDDFVRKYKKKTADTIIVPILVDGDRKIDFSDIEIPISGPYIIHTGTMLEQKDGISIILKSFAKYKKVSRSNLKLVFTGPQANSECSYNALISELGIKSDVVLLGMVGMEEVDVLQHFAKMSIVYKSDNLQTRNCFPTKLGEILLQGIPLITTSVGEANRYLRNRENAIIVDAGDEDALADAIGLVCREGELVEKIVESGKILATSQFSPIVHGKRLYDFYTNL